MGPSLSTSLCVSEKEREVETRRGGRAGRWRREGARDRGREKEEIDVRSSMFR